MDILSALDLAVQKLQIIKKSTDLQMQDGNLARSIAAEILPALEATLVAATYPVNPAAVAVCKLTTVSNTGFEGETTMDGVTPSHYGRIIAAMNRRDDSMEVNALMMYNLRKLSALGRGVVMMEGQEGNTKAAVVKVGGMSYYADTLQRAIADACEGEINAG